MNKYFRYLIILILAIVVCIILFITGKKHNITMTNNINSDIKYSIEGEPYKSLSANKKAKFYLKGMSGIIFVKIGNDVKTINMKLGTSGDYNLNLDAALKGEANFLEKIVIVEEVPADDTAPTSTDETTIPN